jgi:hypothetical protein
VPTRLAGAGAPGTPRLCGGYGRNSAGWRSPRTGCPRWRGRIIIRGSQKAAIYRAAQSANRVGVGAKLSESSRCQHPHRWGALIALLHAPALAFVRAKENAPNAMKKEEEEEDRAQPHAQQ